MTEDLNDLMCPHSAAGRPERFPAKACILAGECGCVYGAEWSRALRLADGDVGMTLRDYFAAKFAAAMMTATSSDRDYPNIDYQRDPGGPTVAERVATIAYRLADAMLKAREGE